MSNDLNRCEFIGRLGRDPEAAALPNGNAVSKFSIAVGESWKDKQTGEKQERTTWVNIVAFGLLAEVMNKYLTKGSRIFVSGKLSVRKYEKDGQTKYATEVIASEMQMLDSRGSAGAGEQDGYEGYGQKPAGRNAYSDAKGGASNRQAPPVDDGFYIPF